MPDPIPAASASPTSTDRMERIEAKLDRLLASDADEQIAGVVGTIRKVIEPPWVQRGIQAVTVVFCIWVLGRLGYLTPQQQADLAGAALHNAVPAVQIAPAPEAQPEADPTPSAPVDDQGEPSAQHG